MNFGHICPICGTYHREGRKAIKGLIVFLIYYIPVLFGVKGKKI